MKARTRKGKAIHRVTLVGDVGWMLFRVMTDCGIVLDDYVEVITSGTTCRGCLKVGRR